MSAESFIVTLTDGTTDYTYYLQSRSGYKTRYAYSANTTGDRRFIDIDHQIKPAGSVGTDSHFVTIRREVVNATTGALDVFSVGVVMKVPRGTSFSAANIANEISALQCLFHKDFMSQFSLGGTPSGDYNVTGPFNPVRT